MITTNYKIYSYRWIGLLFLSFMVGIVQLLWTTFPPITSEAMSFYSVSAIKIGLLSVVYMLAYLVVSIPASWVIDTFGVRKGGRFWCCTLRRIIYFTRFSGE